MEEKIKVCKFRRFPRIEGSIKEYKAEDYTCHELRNMESGWTSEEREEMEKVLSQCKCEQFASDMTENRKLATKLRESGLSGWEMNRIREGR